MHRRIAAVADLTLALAAGDEPREPVVDGGSDRKLLICTHGSRDRCCGRLGTILHRSASARWPDVDVHRISHTGGHRFAPTAILLPSGTACGPPRRRGARCHHQPHRPLRRGHLTLPRFDGHAQLRRPGGRGRGRGSGRVEPVDGPRQAVTLAEPEPDRPGRFEIHCAERSSGRPRWPTTASPGSRSA